jgi:uncharacterized protein YifE (UPF0438 family)
MLGCSNQSAETQKFWERWSKFASEVRQSQAVMTADDEIPQGLGSREIALRWSLAETCIGGPPDHLVRHHGALFDKGQQVVQAYGQAYKAYEGIFSSHSEELMASVSSSRSVESLKAATAAVERKYKASLTKAKESVAVQSALRAGAEFLALYEELHAQTAK